MARIEGFWVKNYRSLRDVALGRFENVPDSAVLTPLTVVIGKNGSGKTTLFDAFGFLADCLAMGVEAACDREQRGGFERMRSMRVWEPVCFIVQYRETEDHPPISYALNISMNRSGRPFVGRELLLQSRFGGEAGDTYSGDTYLKVSGGKGIVLANEEASSTKGRKQRGPEQIELTDTNQLGIASLGVLRDHPHISRFRDFLKGWYLSYFQPDAARGLPLAGPQRHLNAHGDNLGNVVQFLQREHKDRFDTILKRIAEKIPGVQSIDTHVTEDKRVLLRFNDAGFQDPFYAQQMSDGTLKVFAYLLLLEDPDPPPLICIEEPENGLYHKLLETLAREFRAHATGKPGTPQIFVTTHQPYFVDALSPEEVWILEKGADGFSTIRRASDMEIVRNMVAEGLPLGGLWYADYLDRDDRAS